MPIDWKRFAEVVNAHQSFVLTSHMRPDCDALGSELGMAGVLAAAGKPSQTINGDGVPHHLRFIDPEQRIQVLGESATPADIAQADAIMVLDTSSWAQLGPMADAIRATSVTRIVLDHHVSDEDLGAETFKDSAAEATGRLVIEAADALGVALTQSMAEPLFAAIATDTGWFRFPSVTAETYRATSRLIEAGASPQTIYSALYEQDTLARLHLRGRILSSVRIESDGRLAHAQVTQQDFTECGAEPNDTEDAINMLLRVQGVQAAVLFIEQPDGGVRASFRSRSNFDARALAEQFGGGGHTMAAGASHAGPLGEAKQEILDAARRAVG